MISKLKESPIVVSLSIVGMTAGALTGIGTITGWYDAAHTSEVELRVVELKVDETRSLTRCSTLEIRIALTEQTIWQLEQTEPNSQRLVEKRRELRNLEAEYTSFNCSKVLAA